MNQKIQHIVSGSLLCLGGFFSACQGQNNPHLEATQPIIRPDTTPISAYVVETFLDKDDALWMGTMDDGAVRYNGKNLRYLNTQSGLCDNTVASICQDKSGNMWFGTHAGATKFDGKTYTSYTKKDGLHGMGCNLLVDQDGNLWAGTNHGVFRFDGTAFIPFPLPKPEIDTLYYKWEVGKIWSLIQDKKGNLWFGRDGLGACKFDGKTFTLFTQKDGLCSNNVSKIMEDQQGNIWFASLSSDFPIERKIGGVSRFDGEKFTQFRDIQGLYKSDVYTLFTDKKGHVWIGAIGLGAYRYDGQTFTLFNQTDRSDLTKNFGIQSILEDEQGTLWFGFSGGLFRFNGSSFEHVTRGMLGMTATEK